MKRLLSLALLAGVLLPGKTMLYLGTFPNKVLVIDESTYQIVKRIEMRTDIPRNLVLTNDKSKLIVATIKDAGIEVIDLAKNEVEDSFHVRRWQSTVCPSADSRSIQPDRCSIQT